MTGAPSAPERARRRAGSRLPAGRDGRHSGWTLALWGVLGTALALRLWGIKHGLPFVYNVDEAANFVPTAVSFYFTEGWNPHYFVNPPGFSYLLHAVLGTWFGGGSPLYAGDEVGRAYATDPTAVFVLARATAAVLGTAAVGFVYLAGARLFDRRAGLVAAALMAVSFLPVFYSHFALNDVPALLPLAISVYGSAGVLAHGRLRDYVIAGAGLGFAAATKYTAVIVVLPLIAACASQFLVAKDRRPILLGAAAAGGMAAACFLLANPHALLSYDEFASGVRKQATASSGFGKLGLDYDSGIVYYLWVSTWGLGWLPLAGAALGAAALAARDRARALFLVPWPVVFVLFMGLQERYFGRWLLPALPALALLAGYGSVWLADRLGRTGPQRTALVACAAVALAAQGLVYSVHADRVLARDDTRNLARAWMTRNLPPRAKVVVEPIVPDAWFSETGSLRDLPPARRRLLTESGRRWIKFPTARTTIDEQGRRRRGGVGRFVTIEDYERTTRPALVGSYERGGYCWVMIGSTQYGRAFSSADEVPNAIRYYRLLGERGKVVFRADPYKDGAGPVDFNFDWSFDHYPMAYERPGPTVIVYRLNGAACGPRAR